MKLDYMASWNDAIAILREKKESILAIAGVFIFLPSLLMAQFVGQPAVEGAADFAALSEAYSAHFEEHSKPIIFSYLLMLFGDLAIYFVISSSKTGTVADHFVSAFKAFLVFVIASIIAGFLAIGGLFLFIVPGLYISCRLIVVPLVITAQGQRNPVEILKKSWQITKDNGFSILLFVLIITIVGSITIGVFGAVVGLIANLSTGGAGLPLLENFVGALLGSAFETLLIAVVASIYFQLTDCKSDVENIIG